MALPYPAPTPHIAAKPGDFAPTVLMPGDPLRSKFIAENFLEDIRMVNNVRGVHGYTGTYKGIPVSVMASGMGIPSIGIYSYELFNFFDVQNIIRVGSAGSMQEDVHIRDIVFGMGACTTSSYANQYHLPGTHAAIASYPLLKTAVDVADRLGAKYHVGNILSSDPFYGDDADLPTALQGSQNWKKMGVMAVEMEAAGLYMTAARAKKNALAICTISDNLFDPSQNTTAEERQTSFTEMMQVALETAKEMY